MAYSYLEHYRLCDFKQPYLILNVWVSDDPQELEDDEVYIHHDGIKKEVKKQFLEAMEGAKYFSWNGKHENSMVIRLR